MKILYASPQIKILFLCTIVVVFIFSYGFFVRNYLKKDVLENKFANCTGCDYWAVTHFAFFAILGFMFPQHLLLLTLVGIIWEFIETLLGTREIKLSGRRLMLIGSTDENGNVTDPEKDKWWYGRVSDIAFNTVGIVIGITLRLYYDGGGQLCSDVCEKVCETKSVSRSQ